METNSPVTSRLLLAVDHAVINSAVLLSAVRLAGVLRAELEGLFVEDINLINMASLPFTREVAAGSGVVRSVDSLSIRRTLRLRAEGVRHNLLTMSAEAQVQCSFRTICSERISEIYSAMETVDVVMTAGEAVHPVVTANCIVTLFTDAMSCTQSLLIAQQLAAQNHCPLKVIVPADKADELESQAVELLGQSAGSVHFRREHDISPERLGEIVAQEQGIMLIVKFVAGDKAGLRKLLTVVQQPVVFTK